MWEEATPADSHFDHSQQIYSGYLGYTMKFGKFGVKAGARAEGTSLKVRYELAPDMNFGNDYFDVVPSAVVSYQLSMSQQLRLGYNMRIQRPGIWYLNPYVSNAIVRVIPRNPRLILQHNEVVIYFIKKETATATQIPSPLP